MPKMAANGLRPDKDKLYQLAAPQGGYFTLEQAEEAGYSPPLLAHYVNKAWMTRAARGILRLVHFPPSNNEDFIVAWLWSRKQGVFSHETALMLHGLSDVLARIKHLIVPNSWKRHRYQVPEGISLHYADLDEHDIEWKDAIPVTTPLRTIVDATIDSVAPDLVQQALDDGVKRKMFSRHDVRALIKQRRAEANDMIEARC